MKKTAYEINQRTHAFQIGKGLGTHIKSKGTKPNWNTYPKAREKSNMTEFLTQVNRFPRGFRNMQSVEKEPEIEKRRATLPD